MDTNGIKRDDCFEKEDLIKRIQEVAGNRQKASDQARSSSKPSDSTGTRTKPTFTPSGRNFTCQPKQEAVIFKITSVGNSEVGKSCLIKRYCEGRFVKRYITTIGVDYGVKKLSIKDHSVSINFFDLSGNNDYKLIRQEFYKDTSGIVMVYDQDDRDSFSSLVHWEDEMKRCEVDMARVKVVVCGNKADLKSREVNP